MSYTVYIIRSKNDNYMYTGMTNNLERRLYEHNNGKTKSTKHYAPYTLIYSETVDDSKTARKREVFLKGGQGKNRIKENYLQ